MLAKLFLVCYIPCLRCILYYVIYNLYIREHIEKLYDNSDYYKTIFQRKYNTKTALDLFYKVLSLTLNLAGKCNHE